MAWRASGAVAMLGSGCLLATACGRAWFQTEPHDAGPADAPLEPDGEAPPDGDAGPDAPEAPDGGPAWAEIGGSATGLGVSGHGATAACKAVVASRSGRLYAVWADDSTGIRQVYLKYWDGASWVQLGGSGEAGGLSQVAAPGLVTCAGGIAFDSQDRPYVVWMQGLADAQAVYLKYWDGSAWTAIGSSATGYGLSGQFVAWWPTVNVDWRDRPVVSWSKSAEVYLLRYEAGAWSGVGGSDQYPTELAGNHGGNGQAVALFADEIFVAYYGDWAGTSGIYLTHWDGASWAGLGGSMAMGGLSAAGATAEFPQLLLDATAQPILLWHEASAAGDDLRMVQWDGMAWSSLGGDIGGPQAFRPSFCRWVNGRIVVTFDEQMADSSWLIRVRSWDGAGWTELPDPRAGMTPLAEGSWPSVGAAPDGSLLLSWEEQVDATNRVVYLKTLAPE